MKQIQDKQEYNKKSEEINLFDLFLLIGKYKRFIILFVVVCVSLAGIYIFFLSETTYRSEAVVELSANHYYRNEADTIFTVRPILENTINELNLEQRYEMSIIGLKESIEVNTSDNSNLITISAKHGDPETAQQITDQIIENFNEYVTESIVQEPKAQIAYLEKQVDDARNQYNERYQVLQKIKQTGDPLEVLQNDYNSAVSALKPARQNLSNIVLEYEAAKKVYEQTGLQLSQTPEKFLLQKSFNMDTVFLFNAMNSSDNGDQDYSDLKFNDEIINPLYEKLLLENNTQYQELITLEAEKTVLREKVSRLEKEIEELYPKIEEKKKNIEDTVNEMNYAKNDFKRYEEMLNNAQNQIVTRQNENNVTVLSSAYLPVNGEKTSSLIIIIAFISSLMAAVLLIFVFEFYKSYNHYKREMISKESSK